MNNETKFLWFEDDRGEYIFYKPFNILSERDKTVDLLKKLTFFIRKEEYVSETQQFDI